MRLDPIRQGDTVQAGYLDDRTDSPPTDECGRQIEGLTAGNYWLLAVTSPLFRSRLPAIALAEWMEARLRVDPDWAELDPGLWEGRKRKEIEADASERDRLDALYSDPVATAPPSGQDWRRFQDRVVRCIAHLMTKAGGHPAGVITHAGPIRAALSLTTHIPLRSLWSVRIGHAPGLTLDVGDDNGGKLWGELLGLAQQ